MNPEDVRSQAPRPGPSPRSAVLDEALDHALARLDGLEAVSVHDHVDVYTAVDLALRERLAATEG